MLADLPPMSSYDMQSSTRVENCIKVLDTSFLSRLINLKDSNPVNSSTLITYETAFYHSNFDFSSVFDISEQSALEDIDDLLEEIVISKFVVKEKKFVAKIVVEPKPIFKTVLD